MECAQKTFPAFAEELLAPTDLTVAHISPEDVVLGWKWETQGVDVEDVEFNITTTCDFDTIESSVPGTLEVELSGLRNGTEYNVTITASLIDGTSVSEPFKGSFETIARGKSVK